MSVTQAQALLANIQNLQTHKRAHPSPYVSAYSEHLRERPGSL